MAFETKTFDTKSFGTKTFGDEQPILTQNLPPQKGWFEDLFSAEIGGADTLLSGFFTSGAEKAVVKEAEVNGQLAELFHRLPDGEQKDRLREQLRKVVQAGPTLKFNEIIPTANKTSSQALGEATALGLLVTPWTEVKALKSLPFVGRFLSAGVVGGAYMGALSLAEEGQIKEKAPDIATMSGIGFVGTGTVSGVLPPLLKKVPVLAKKIFDRIRYDKAVSNIALPTMETRFVQKGKVKTAELTAKGARPIQTQMSEIDGRLLKAEQELDNLTMSTKFIAPAAGSNRGAIEVTDKVLKEKAARISALRKDIQKLEDKRDKIVISSGQKEWKMGDTIFSKEMGRVTINHFVGREGLVGYNINGQMVFVDKADMLGFKKITKPTEAIVKRFNAIPDVEVGSVTVGKPRQFLFGLRRYVNTTGNLLNAQGLSGQKMRGLMSTALDETSRKIGAFRVPLERAIRELRLDKTPFTLAEKKNIVDILDEGLRVKATDLSQISTQPLNDRVHKFLKVFSQITKELVNEADKRGLQVRDRATGKKHAIGEAFIHFPHLLKDKGALLANKTELVQLLGTRGVSDKKANALLHSFVRDKGVNRFNGIENARTFMIEGFDELQKYGYETDPILVLNEFIEGSARRLTEAKYFGPNNEVIAKLLDNIGAEGYDKGIAQEVWGKYSGNRGISETEKDFSLAVRSFQTVSKLALAQILNTTQLVNTATEVGTFNLVRAFKKYYLDKTTSREIALRSGVLNEAIDRALSAAGADTKISKDFLRNVGFTKVENFNRIVTVQAARQYLEKSLPQILSGKLRPATVRELERLGINVKKVERRGRFSEEELKVAGQKLVNSTQFRGSVLDIPLAWSSPAGKIITQFKSFAWQQGVFVKDIIGKEMLQGNMHPLLTYLIASQMTGEPVADIRAVLRGDLEFRGDLSIADRLVDNQLTVGGLGLSGDLFRSMYRIQQGNYFVSTSDLLLGATPSDVAHFLDGVAQLSGGDPDRLIQMGGKNLTLATLLPKVRDVPGSGVMLRVLGDILANMVTK